MTKKSISCVVITEKEKPVGMITECDMVKKVLHKGLDIQKTTIEKVMSSPLITASPDIDIFSASAMMKKRRKVN